VSYFDNYRCFTQEIFFFNRIAKKISLNRSNLSLDVRSKTLNWRQIALIFERIISLKTKTSFACVEEAKLENYLQFIALTNEIKQNTQALS